MDINDSTINKNITLQITDTDNFVKVAKALGSDLRAKILLLLSSENLNINELTERLQLPFSTVALNVRVLEDAGIILTELQPGSRGSVMKICSRNYDTVFLDLHIPEPKENSVNSFYLDMPIGHYCDCKIYPTCGIASEKGLIDADDSPRSFYHPDRTSAQLLWFYKGYIEYRFSNSILKGGKPELMELSMELCSEAPFYRLDWPSDITIWINDIEICTWTCPGDFGGRRGKLTPEWWSSTATQYGLLKTWQVQSKGTFVDGIKMSSVAVQDLPLEKNDFIKMRIGIKDTAKNIGGLNLFGEKFGDHPQNIQMRLDYSLLK
jgi:predicted transcriptional regulator